MNSNTCNIVISTAANSNNSNSSIANKRQGKLPEQLKICHFNVPKVTKEMCNDFELDFDKYDVDNERSYDVKHSNNITDNLSTQAVDSGEDLISIDSPSSESSFSSVDSSSSLTEEPSSPDTSDSPDSLKDEEESQSDYATDSLSTTLVNAPMQSEQYEAQLIMPTRIIVTDCDLPATHLLHKIEMSFSTIKTHVAWPAHTTYWQEDTSAAQSNRIPTFVDSNLLATPPRNNRGLLDTSVRSYWDGRSITVEKPTLVITSPTGEKEIKQVVVAGLTRGRKHFSVPELALRRVSLTNKFNSTPRSAPKPPQQQVTASKPSVFQTYPLVRRANASYNRFKKGHTVKHVQQNSIIVQQAPVAKAQCTVLESTVTLAQAASPTTTSLSSKTEKHMAKRSVRFVIDETLEPEPIYTPASAKIFAATAVRSVLKKREPKSLRSILVKQADESLDGTLERRRGTRNVSFAAKDEINIVTRWNYAEPKVAVKSVRFCDAEDESDYETEEDDWSDEADDEEDEEQKYWRNNEARHDENDDDKSSYSNSDEVEETPSQQYDDKASVDSSWNKFEDDEVFDVLGAFPTVFPSRFSAVQTPWPAYFS